MIKQLLKPFKKQGTQALDADNGIGVKPDGHTMSDREILELVRQGDIDAYEHIMRRYNQRLFRLARSIILDDGHAMDVVQEVHIKAYQKFRTLSSNSNFSAWIMTIAKNEALMARRKLKPGKMQPTDVIELDTIRGSEMNKSNSTPTPPDSIAENNQLRYQLSHQIDALPEKFRTVFIMRGVEQLSVRETAQVLDLHETTVKTRFFRAKALLQEKIVRDYGPNIYEVGGQHCDEIVRFVLTQIHKQKTS